MVSREKLREITSTLASAGVFDPVFEAREIIREYAGASALMTGEVREEALPVIDAAVKRRVAGEPLQYIFGQWEFYGLPFYVGRGVLIPRPETELLTDIAAQRLDSGSTVLDLCSGTGCIPVSIAVRTGAKCYAVELYDEAFSYLERNIELNGVPVTALKADARDSSILPGLSFDAIFSNPPYLTETEMCSLMRELRHEPPSALYGGTDGLDFYRALIPAWAGRLAPGGFLAVEIGETQGAAVAQLMTDAGLYSRIVKDPAGADRVVCGETADIS